MSTVLTWALGILSTSTFGLLTIRSPDGQRNFGAKLSPGAEIYFPGSADFVQAATRWTASQTPQYDMIVKVATEEDVQKTILYANENDKPFLTITGGHGMTSSINNVKNGIGIWMVGMNKISLIDDGQAALIDGGVFNGDLVPYLWSHGKQTATTGCDCVGYLAPILGGGHGWLQGQYGFATDQLISARMVFANGTAITVDEASNPDLFWAIRGAGHNFGVFTQVKMKVYDVAPAEKQWAVSIFSFTQDKLEAVFSLANSWLKSSVRPAGMTHYAAFLHSPEVDPVNPIVIMSIYFQGPSIPAEYTDALRALSPFAVNENVGDLASVNAYQGANRDGAACAKGFSRAVVPVSLTEYSLPALRQVLNIIAALPPDFRSSVMMLEGWPTNRVQEIHSDSTAFPDRDRKLLLSPVLTWTKNASLDAKAWEIGGEIRRTLLEGNGGKLEAYVNYARGDESIEEIYGDEPWRLEKLRRLKKEYDPFGRFNFYAPIS